jgi:subtilisin family serine protease
VSTLRLVGRAGLVALVLMVWLPAAAGASNDPFFARQWNLAEIGAPQAWGKATGKDVLIGVVDTGIDGDHPDLVGKVVATAECLNGPCREGGGQDDNGHGTEVSGIAAAVTGNGKGIAGVAPDAKLLVAKSLDATGSGRVDDINAGIRWVVDHGAKVVNLSLGDPDFLLTSLVGTPLRPGVEYAWTRGAVPVLASGNYRVGVVDLGASNYGELDAMVVEATDRSSAVPSYSSAIGKAKWGLAAPGGLGAAGGTDENVIAPSPGGNYHAVAGTSAAAPHVSGAIADLLSIGLSPTAAVQRVLATLDHKLPCGQGCQGRLDLGAAVAGGGPPTTPATTAPPTTIRTAGGPTTPGDQPVVGVQPGDRTSGAEGDSRNRAVIVAAVVLVAAAASGVGGVSWTRLRGGAGS